MRAKKRFSVLLIESNPIMRLGFATVVENQPDMIVCAEASSGDEAVRLYCEHHPDLTLLDLRLSGGMSGLQTLRAIRALDPEARCTVLTGYQGDANHREAIKAGALGCIVEGMSVEAVAGSLRRVLGGSRFLPAQAGRRLEAWNPNSDLSPREREVLSLIAQGKSNREIADALKITQATVKSHVGVIFVRLGVAHRTQAAITALRQGFAHL